MEITGTQTIPAPRDVVWAALNNPEVLKKCLPGCESVEATTPEEFKVVVVTAIGPLRARFNGVLRMSEVNAPQSCVMVFEGQGGAVGFAKGSATVTLKIVAEGTELNYAAKAQIGGKLAQVGSRLIDSVAKKMSDDFFKAFRKQLAPPDEVAAAADTPATPSTASTALATQDTTPHAVAAPANAVAPATSAPAPSTATLVPGWWLIVAALVGSATTLAGALLIR
jgi:carbon monoxide dehydrogenase subunit G